MLHRDKTICCSFCIKCSGAELYRSLKASWHSHWLAVRWLKTTRGKIRGRSCFASCTSESIPTQMFTLHTDVDRWREGPAQGMRCRHLKTHPSLTCRLTPLTLDSSYLGAFLLCPHPAKVHPHSILWKDSVTKRNKARLACGLSQQI